MVTSDRGVDGRVFTILCCSVVAGEEQRDSTIEVRASGAPKRKPPIGHFIENLVQMLWIDAYSDGPWTPSFIESVTISQKDGNVMTYSRQEATDA